MKILVTGGAGFIGSAVVRLAVARGHEVVNLDALTYAACLENVASVAASPLTPLNAPTSATARQSMRCWRGTPLTRSCTLPPKAMWTAASTAPANSSRPTSAAPINLLEAARDYWARQGRPEGFRLHHISTDEVFGSLGRRGQVHRRPPPTPRAAPMRPARRHLTIWCAPGMRPTACRWC